MRNQRDDKGKCPIDGLTVSVIFIIIVTWIMLIYPVAIKTDKRLSKVEDSVVNIDKKVDNLKDLIMEKICNER